MRRRSPGRLSPLPASPLPCVLGARRLRQAAGGHLYRRAGQRGGGASLDIGSNTAHEACTLQPGTAGRAHLLRRVSGGGRAHIVKQTPAADPTSFVTESALARGLRPSLPVRRASGGDGAGCAGRRPVLHQPEGGWPHAVIATRIGDTLYVADAVGPAAPVLPRAIGVFAGRLPAVAAAATPAPPASPRSARPRPPSTSRAPARSPRWTGRCARAPRQIAKATSPPPKSPTAPPSRCSGARLKGRQPRSGRPAGPARLADLQPGTLLRKRPAVRRSEPPGRPPDQLDPAAPAERRLPAGAGSAQPQPVRPRH